MLVFAGIAVQIFRAVAHNLRWFSEGEHTRTKTVVRSKVGGLSAFTTKKETCIGCKTPMDTAGETREPQREQKKENQSEDGKRPTEVLPALWHPFP